MPTFTIKETEKQRQLSGKIQGLPIAKTIVRGRKIRRKISYHRLNKHTKTKNLFKVTGLCKASMKKDFRKVFVIINCATSMMSSAGCSCPAGKSGHSKHVMVLLLELAGYSLRKD